MNLQTEKIELAKLVLSTENPSIIKAVKKIFEKDRSDFWDSLSSDQKEEIKKATLEIEEGKTVDYETFISKHR